MARNPDEIEREIRQKRQEISRRIEEVTKRTSKDAGEAGLRVKHLVEGLDFKRILNEHPTSALAGALALGVALGMASEGPPRGSQGSPSEEKQRAGYQRHGQSALSSGLLSTLLYQLEGAVVQEGRQLIHEWIRPRKDGVTDPSAGSSRYPGSGG